MNHSTEDVSSYAFSFSSKWSAAWPPQFQQKSAFINKMIGKNTIKLRPLIDKLEGIDNSAIHPKKGNRKLLVK